MTLATRWLLIIDLYISGYGRIDNSKLAFYPPVSVLSDSGSAVTYGFTYQNEQVERGRHTDAVSERGITLPTRASPDDRWPGYTSFFDVEEEDTPHRHGNFAGPRRHLALHT